MRILTPNFFHPLFLVIFLMSGATFGRCANSEIGTRAPVRIAYQIGASPIQGIVKPCS